MGLGLWFKAVRALSKAVQGRSPNDMVRISGLVPGTGTLPTWEKTDAEAAGTRLGYAVQLQSLRQVGWIDPRQGHSLVVRTTHSTWIRSRLFAHSFVP